jgi:hypothetical protein
LPFFVDFLVAKWWNGIEWYHLTAIGFCRGSLDLSAQIVGLHEGRDRQQ